MQAVSEKIQASTKSSLYTCGTDHRGSTVSGDCCVISGDLGPVSVGGHEDPVTLYFGSQAVAQFTEGPTLLVRVLLASKAGCFRWKRGTV